METCIDTNLLTEGERTVLNLREYLAGNTLEFPKTPLQWVTHLSRMSVATLSVIDDPGRVGNLEYIDYKILHDMFADIAAYALIAVDEMKQQCQENTGKQIGPLPLETLVSRLNGRQEGDADGTQS